MTNKTTPPFPLLAVDRRCRGGLILERGAYAEFAGPGSVVYSPGDGPYRHTVALGQVHLVPLIDPEARRRAYQYRGSWQRWLHRIAAIESSEMRVEALLASFKGLFAPEVVDGVDAEVLAALVGVFPTTVQRAKSRYLATPKPATPFTRDPSTVPAAVLASHPAAAQTPTVYPLLLHDGLLAKSPRQGRETPSPNVVSPPLLHQLDAWSAVLDQLALAV